MFHHAYFSAVYFAPVYWPPAVVVAAPVHGYEVYLRDTQDAVDRLIAHVDPGIITIDLDGFAAGSEAWVSVRAVSGCGVRDIEPLRLKRLRFDGEGNLVEPSPNAPVALQLRQAVGGRVIASWGYIAGGLPPEARPATFGVYVAIDGAAFDFDADPTATVAYYPTQSFSATLGPFSNGATVRVIVRATSVSDGQETNRIERFVVADAQAPADPASITVEAL